MRGLIIVFIVLIGTTVQAGDLPGIVNFKEFELADFGTSQGQELICIKGPCLVVTPVSSRNPISSYKKPIDITHFGEVQISSPRYDYFEDKMFQVSFRIQGSAGNPEFLLDDVGIVLESRFGLHHLESYSEDLSPEHAERIKVYGYDNDVIAIVNLKKRRGKWLVPIVKIYNKQLIENVRLALNPNYVGN